MKKKMLIIGIIVITLIVIISAVVGGIFIYKNQPKTGTKWGDLYLKELKKDCSEHDYSLSTTNKEGVMQETQTIKVDYFKDASDVKIQFIEVFEDYEPMMAVTYKKDGLETFNLYYINNVYSTRSVQLLNSPSKNEFVDGILKESKQKDNYDLRLLYNIELGKYIWYLHSINENGYEYFSDLTCDPTFKLNIGKESNKTETYTGYYNFSPDEMKMDQKDENGTPILSKFEETFIIPENIEENVIQISDIHNIDEKELKEYVKESVANYKKLEEIITEDVKVATESKKTELENKKEQIKIANEEKAKKEAEEKARAEEEARKKAEEAAKGLKIGKYTMKYGKYRENDTGVYGNIYLTINPDGTYTYKGDGRNLSGKYKIGSFNVLGGNNYGLILENGWGFCPSSSTQFYIPESSMVYDYVGK